MPGPHLPGSGLREDNFMSEVKTRKSLIPDDTASPAAKAPSQGGSAAQARIIAMASIFVLLLGAVIYYYWPEPKPAAELEPAVEAPAEAPRPGQSAPTPSTPKQPEVPRSILAG
jgi:hypothetical protein